MINLSASNIAWKAEDDEEMYLFLSHHGFCGIEIAPTRIIWDSPYQYPEQIASYSQKIARNYDLKVCSLQSIWYGRKEKLFNSKHERDVLFDYTQKAIDFAVAANCPNLVFGSPKNRRIKSSQDFDTALSFFQSLGEYAISKNTAIAIEPNPAIYGTNFINNTSEAFEFVQKIKTKGIRVNVDLGTIIENNESIEMIAENINYINHIHISEPYLEPIQPRSLHKELIKILKDSKYKKFLSIEMKNSGNVDHIKSAVNYLGELTYAC